MGGPKSTEFLAAPTRLKSLIGPEGAAGVTSETFAAAEKTLSDMAPAYLEIANRDVDRLRDACARLTLAPADSAARGEVNRLFYDLSGQAGSFGLPRLSRVGKLGCQFLESARASEALRRDQIEVLRLHADAARLLLAAVGRDGDGAELQSIVDGLEQVAARPQGPVDSGDAADPPP
jgi:hypothetical protein